MPPEVAEWGWNVEVCPETQRKHYQGFLRTYRQHRFKAIATLFPKVHLEIPRNWDALKNYCKKENTRLDGTVPIHATNPNKQLTMAGALIRLAGNRPEIDTDAAFNRGGEPAVIKLFRYEYETAVRNLLEDEPELIGLYSQPQYERSWIKWRSVWIRHSTQTDRQTDNDVEEAVKEVERWYDDNIDRS